MAVSTIPKALHVYHVFVEGTVDAYGRLLDTGLDISNKYVVGILSVTHAQCVFQLRLNTNYLGLKFVKSDSLNPVDSGTTCGANVYYVLS